jgi:hypothetical protein
VLPRLLRNEIRKLLSRDLWAGVVFVTVGIAALALGRDLTVGSPAEMGEGFVPRMMAVSLIALGALISTVAWFQGAYPIERVNWRPLFFVTAAILAFAATLELLGLIAAIAASTITANFAGRPLRWRALVFLAAVLCLGVIVLFVWGIGLPLRVLPRFGG